MESLQIVLDHTEAKFLPGSAICGYLRVVLSSQVGINAITLGVYGKAETKFSQVQVSEDTSFASGSSGLSSCKFTDSQIVINKKKVLWKPKGSSRNLKAGIHCFPFVFRLPSKCPPSFDGASGRIHYGLSGSIQLHWAAEKCCTFPFIVLQNNELAIAGNAAQPFLEEFERDCKLIFWNYGTVSTKVEMEKRNFVPDEKFIVKVAIKNGTSRQIECVRLKLEQFITYKAYLTDPTDETIEQQIEVSEENNVLLEDRKIVKIPPHGHDKLEFDCQLSRVAPSFNSCRIINVSYELRIILSGGFLSQKIKIEIPIVVVSVISQEAINTTAESPANIEQYDSSSMITHSPVGSCESAENS